MTAVIRLLLISTFTATIAFAQQPQANPRGAVNGNTFHAAPTDVAAGGFLSIFGPDLASSTAAASDIPLPTQLGDPVVEVLVDGVPQPLFSISPNQINIQLGWEIEPGFHEVIVRRGGVDSAPMLIRVRPAEPSMFTFGGNHMLAVHADNRLVDAANPPVDGETIILFSTSLGNVDSVPANGDRGPTPLANTTRTQHAFAGGVRLPVAFAGLQPQFVSLFQMNVVWSGLAGAGDSLQWYSGRLPGEVVQMGFRSEPLIDFVPLPEGAQDTQRITATDLNGRYLALSGPLADDFCYEGVYILDVRRGTTTQPEGCMFPVNPLAPNVNALRPFGVIRNRPVLAALMEGEGDFGDAITNRMRLFDSSAGTMDIIEIPPADRLRPGGGAAPTTGIGGALGLFVPDTAPVVRLDRPGITQETATLNPDSLEISVNDGAAPLPDPLEVGPLTVRVGGNFTLGDGFRGRILAPAVAAASEEGAPQQGTGAEVVLFGPDGQVAAQTPYPEGLQPLIPPRNLNPRGIPVGNAFASVTRGFDGVTTVLALARSADGSQDAIVSFAYSLPEPAAIGVQQTVPVETAVTALPTGYWAASCSNSTPILRFEASQLMGVIAAKTLKTEFSRPCGGEALVIFDPNSNEIRAIDAPGMIDNQQRNIVSEFLYTGDATRPIANGPSNRLYVFDSFSESFSTIEFPDGLGININNATQRYDSLGAIITTATAPEPTNMQGVPIPGNSGLMVIDLVNKAARRLALPEGFGRVLPTVRYVAQGSHPFGLVPGSRKVFARVTSGAGMPPPTQFMLWDYFTGEAAPVPNPEGVMFVVTGPGGAGGGTQVHFDFNPRSGSFAAMGYDEGGVPLGVMVVTP